MTVSEVLQTLRPTPPSPAATSRKASAATSSAPTATSNTTQLVENVVLRSAERGSSVGRVTVRDIATVEIGYKKPRARPRQLGESALGFNITREQGANVIRTIAAAQDVMKGACRRPAPKQQGLKIEQVYDETVYINSSIDLVMQNIYVGGTLAIIILMLFLRSWRPTAVVAMSIPVSVIGSFVAMAALGRSLNVISLAGIAFAVGMVVDAAIVVLENIYRLRQEGKSRAEAAYLGAQQVWPAVLVSALTTVMVFIPILIMDLEVGQLFRDIAVAISVSVMLSLLVSITLIPALARNLLTRDPAKQEKTLRIPFLDDFAAAFSRFWVNYARMVFRWKALAIGLVSGITALAILISIAIIPKLDYLPTGNRNFVIGFILPPAGYNLDTNEQIAINVETAMRRYWSRGEQGQKNAEEDRVVDRFFIVPLIGRMFIAATHVENRARRGT